MGYGAIRTGAANMSEPDYISLSEAESVYLSRTGTYPHEPSQYPWYAALSRIILDMLSDDTSKEEAISATTRIVGCALGIPQDYKSIKTQTRRTQCNQN